MTTTTKLVNGHTVTPGSLLLYRCNGTGEPHWVRVLPYGPLGQCYVTLVDACGVPVPGPVLAVNPHRELFEAETGETR